MRKFDTGFLMVSKRMEVDYCAYIGLIFKAKGGDNPIVIVIIKDS